MTSDGYRHAAAIGKVSDMNTRIPSRPALALAWVLLIVIAAILLGSDQAHV